MLKQQFNLKLSQKLSPQQIQLMKMIQLTTLDFEQKLQNEIEENPALENGKEEIDSLDEYQEDYNDNEVIDTQEIDIDAYLSDDETPSYLLNSNNYSADDEEKTVPITGGIGFHQHLKVQLSSLILTPDEERIAEFLIGSIDDSGYLRRSLLDIMDDLAFTQNIIVNEEQLELVLEKIHSLDPAGVGARTLQECLSIQLSRKQLSVPQIMASKIINEAFELFSKKHFVKLQDKFDVDEDLLKQGLKEIERLNPKPGGALSGIFQNTHIVPDFILTIENGILNVELNRRNAPELHISSSYKEMMKGYKEAPVKNKSQKEAVQFIKQKLDAAQWFIDAVAQRYQTLYLTINEIVKQQEAYFLSGDELQLKPMILKDIAEKINMDISTVSRVANSKYIDTPYGTKLLKSFFSESLTNEDGEEVSTLEIKKILKTLIEKEDKRKPLADLALSEELLKAGYRVARRTVAKYREQMDFPVARLRKEL
ncbi:RNA polymerase factor sigma-54 [Flavobacteriaceae bacterium]|jgi:RNA polymerase sigma-54 factor|uniref:RNA polymerase factor sigma-54 n=1 Tax=Candidatus Arcticimaribacter forsetii TaxID=2820661 RepID=UPI0020776344|nr:RNA polymerase factor sigma-54 [Candidatus Arcticimaribacter forsetii]MDA8639530.1 RNA polymerase factor sigma-54 [Flavobacteriaceae bacterium]MDB2329239.1 RNA polymerase factor sigma-54 [Flavobacteriaceae bacterium]MDB2345835.1 RNA polymerase factor sigma-54 [Flavobacteriaceae bacterium]MDB4621093.1 RNA polymerase factor sigma-54 [Flavobacteriaceae bacterium]MDB4674644.1 RNA polymerase factor sigma-54 [Flavobacteriaceae bacterium]